MKKHLLFRSFLALMMLLFVGNAWGDPITIFDAAASEWSSATLTSGTTTVGDVTWYGGGSATIDNGATVDGKEWGKRLKFGGSSTIQTKNDAPNLARVLVYNAPSAGTIKVYAVTGSNGSDRYVLVSQELTTTNRDESKALVKQNTNPASVATATVAAGSVYIWADNNIGIYGITFEALGEKHTVTYSAGEGSGTVPTQADVFEGAKFTVAAATGLTAPAGKEFANWYDGTNYYNPEDEYTMGESNVTLTAQWRTITTKSPIVYQNLKGADNSANPTEYAETIGIEEFEPLADVEGYEFIGWNPSSISAEATGQQTITAQWRALPQAFFTMEVAATSTVSIPANTVKQELTSSQATVTGGKAYVSNGRDAAKDLITKDYFVHTNGNTFFVAEMNGYTLQEGDIITATMSAADRGLQFQVSDTYNTECTAKSTAGSDKKFSYTIKATDDEIIGHSTFNIMRATSNSTYFKTFAVSRDMTKSASDLAVTSATEVALTESSINKGTATITYTSELGTGAVTFHSSNEDVATVAEDGTITAVGAGEATIYVCKAADENYYAGRASVNVTVTHKLTATIKFQKPVYGESSSTKWYYSSNDIFAWIADANGNVFGEENDHQLTPGENNWYSVTFDYTGKYNAYVKFYARPEWNDGTSPYTDQNQIACTNVAGDLSINNVYCPYATPYQIDGKNNIKYSINEYTRSVTAGDYGTICLPYGVAANAYSGATFYNVGGVTKQGDAITGIVLVEVNGALKAGKPYIFQADAEQIVVKYAGEPADVQPANGLMGNLGEEKTIAASESAFYYVLSGTTLYHLAGSATATIGKNKAYLNLEGIEVYQAPAQTQSRVAIIPVNGQPTALENSALNAEVKKVVVDGQMMILRDGNMFDLNGRLVK